MSDTNPLHDDVEILVCATAAVAKALHSFHGCNILLARRLEGPAALRICRRVPSYLVDVRRNLSVASQVYSTAHRSLLDRLYEHGIHPAVVKHAPPKPTRPAIRDIRAAMQAARAALSRAIKAIPPGFPERRCLQAVAHMVDAALDGLPKPLVLVTRGGTHA